MNNKSIEKIIRKETRQSDEYTYTYELIERRGKSLADFGMRLYSITVLMKDERGQVRRGEAKDIFACKRKAGLFFDKIVRNLATPIDLIYVVEDEITV